VPVTGKEGIRARAWERGTERDRGWLGGKRTTEKIAMLEHDAMHDREGLFRTTTVNRNDHLIPFGLRDMYTRKSRILPIAASASCDCRTVNNVSADDRIPTRVDVRPIHFCPALTRFARSHSQEILSMFCIIVLTYSSHACTQLLLVYLLLEMIDVCTLVVLLSSAICILQRQRSVLASLIDCHKFKRIQVPNMSNQNAN